MRILLIAGGWSNEREVSLAGARLIEKSIKNLGHEVEFMDLSEGFSHLMDRAEKNDFAFINLHGSPGEDGLIQAMLESVGCPYQGSGPAPSFLALNKAASKQLFERNDIPTPRWALVTGPEDKLPDMELPLFVKPNTGGSSLGMSMVKKREDLIPALEKVFAMGDEALVEECESGVELTCGILDETPLPLIMVRPKEGAPFFDYENKYAEDGAEEICPAPVSKDISDRVQELTLKAHTALGLKGYSRGDYIMTEKGVTLLEMNTLPGMTPTSLLPQQAAQVGHSFDDLIAELIRLGLER